VAVCCSVLQCVAVCCSVLQCVAVCGSVLQCVAAVVDVHGLSLHEYKYILMYNLTYIYIYTYILYIYRLICIQNKIRFLRKESYLPKQLLGSGVSISYTFCCTINKRKICTINSELKVLSDFHQFEWAGVDIRRFPADGFDTRWIPRSFACGLLLIYECNFHL